MYMSVQTTCTSLNVHFLQGSEEKIESPREELQMIVKHHVGTGDWTGSSAITRSVFNHGALDSYFNELFSLMKVWKRNRVSHLGSRCFLRAVPYPLSFSSRWFYLVTHPTPLDLFFLSFIQMLNWQMSMAFYTFFLLLTLFWILSILLMGSAVEIWNWHTRLY